jgi:hypothetical protein
MFGPLREQLSEALAAVDLAEAALARVQATLGGDVARSPQKPVERTPVAARRRSRAGGALAGDRGPRPCVVCGAVFTPSIRGRCPEACPRRECRNKAVSARRREREAAKVNAQTVAVMEQAARDGFPSTLTWASNGDATS